ncbi:long-chain fatty acid--CoA ligase (plasmid) [Parageobacillus thermoglucosidasius]|uniref:long-chain fatty acid--CoA ligase n=1 Tax=Parageobacillus thermoglucosidasius TaxID=1426 RepID=UPI000F625DB6|nr:long-chain fatty acid--CoA ligase [Parageobacillus thermoglucosidasius]GCD84764.1 long-chain-fatty-acid--CoA ligase [Parageobacillus thermoglucosidasius]
MNSFQLNLRTFLERSAQYFSENEIVSREADGSLFRYNYAQYYDRVQRLANALKSIGIKKGDKIASFAWNNHRHLELYFGIPCYGAVLHTVNIRYGEKEIVHTINHAEDKVVFLDKDLLPTMEAIAHQLPKVKAYVILDDTLPETSLSPLFCYEDLLASVDPVFSFEEIDENAPATMCYTSATTGLPKGVVYSHRSIYLHSSTLCHTDVTGISEHDNILPIVPMFHVNAWGIPYAAVATGAKLVLPGTHPKAEDFLKLIDSEKITFAAGAVTVGIDMLNTLEKQPYDISSLRLFMLGGQAIPKAVIEKYFYKYGVPIAQGYGATETSPLVSFLHFRRDQKELSDDEKIRIRSRQGMVIPGIEIKVVNEFGEQVPWDDNHMGEILIRGPWVATEYYNDERSKDSFVDGWWKSGDIATVNEHGMIRIVDRGKDVIKSGGEWISSVQLENELMAHPAVLEACVVAVPHEKWLERPLACVVLKKEQDGTIGKEELVDWLKQKFPKWWLPDQFIFVDEIPKNANGKFNKRLLREWVVQFLAHHSND